MPADFPTREMTPLVSLFQRAHSKVSALQRLDDRIATLVAQHERLQVEVRAVQQEINDEFERALRFNQAPAKIPVPEAAAREVQAEKPLLNGNANGNGHHVEADDEAVELVPLSTR